MSSCPFCPGRMVTGRSAVFSFDYAACDQNCGYVYRLQATQQTPVTTPTTPPSTAAPGRLGQCIALGNGCGGKGSVYAQPDGSATCDTCLSKWPRVGAYTHYAALAAQKAALQKLNTAAPSTAITLTYSSWGWDDKPNARTQHTPGPRRQCAKCHVDWCESLDAWYGARNDPRGDQCSRCRR